MPAASTVDATDGGLDVTTTNDNRGTLQTARVYQGAFTLSQLGGNVTPITLFRLPKLDGCEQEPDLPTPKRAVRATSFARSSRAKRKRRSKHLWVTEKGGKWRTSTGSVSAAAVGTGWVTTIQCDGTRVTVKEGVVLVRDKLRGKKTLLRPGQSVKVFTHGTQRGQ